MKKQFLETGIIVTTHGIKGEFKTLYLDEGKTELVIEKSRVHKNTVLVKAKGIDTPEDAVKLRNKTVYINRDDANIDEDAYFIQDLIGLQVIDVDNGKLYGTLCDVTQTGANDVYHLDANGKLLLVPAIEQVVIEINLEQNKMLIRPLEGLFDDEN
ncbi:MAG: 16S rRNA processing protein RimM [Oscillospiraceae bacterium]|nr:16S rRNA processing protein RimM [Oscillospiraceae bacterium]